MVRARILTKLIADKLDVTESKADKIYYKLVEQGLIDSKQVGKHNSKVWLTSEGKKLISIDENLKILPTLKKRSSMIDKLIPEPIKSIFGG